MRPPFYVRCADESSRVPGVSPGKPWASARAICVGNLLSTIPYTPSQKWRRNNPSRHRLRDKPECLSGGRWRAGGGHGVEISMVAVRRSVPVPQACARCQDERAIESLPRRFRRARQERLCCCASLHRSTLPVATSAETAAADLRRGDLHLPLQAPQGSPRRAASSQRDRHDVAAVEWHGASPLPRPSCRRQVDFVTPPAPA